MSKSSASTRKQRERQAKKGEVAPFSKLYRFMAQSPQFLLLSSAATKVFVILLSRFNGKNNGDLNIARSEMLNIGLGANGIVFSNAIDELVSKGFVVVTRPGKYSTGCTLYAVTCEPIDASPKHDFPEQRTPSNLWRNFPCTAAVQGQALRQCNALKKTSSTCTAPVLVDNQKDPSACTAPVRLLRSSHRQSAREAAAPGDGPAASVPERSPLCPVLPSDPTSTLPGPASASDSSLASRLDINRPASDVKLEQFGPTAKRRKRRQGGSDVVRQAATLLQELQTLKTQDAA